MHARLIGILGVIAAFALWPAGASAITVNSPFNANNENWRTVNDSDCNAPPGPAFWTNSTGNPGGTIRATDSDTADGCGWFFLSPVPLAGNRVANYGGTIGFDIFATGAPSRKTQILLADSQGKLIAAQKSAPPAASTWTTASFVLSETSPDGWSFSSDGGATIAPATQANVFDVLTDLAFVQILGDFRPGGTTTDTTSLDNFKWDEPAAPLDSDGDGVTNTADSCPAQPGLASNNGCPVPDSDGDTVPDPTDQCPAQFGPPSNNGCPVSQPNPDPDGDGLIGTADQCPDQAGPASNNGCPGSAANPDPDGDGLIGTADKCPDKAGPASNDGCPGTAGDDAACDAAKDRLAKAKAKLKKLRRQGAKPAAIAKAKQKVKKAKQAVGDACA